MQLILQQVPYLNQSKNKINNNNNPIYLLICFACLFTLIAFYWQHFKSLPTYLYSWNSAIWALGVYRSLNKNQTSVSNQFFFSFWVAFSWGILYCYLSTGYLITNIQAFLNNFTITLILTSIFIYLPLPLFLKFWNNLIFRWFIFVLDQMNGGWSMTVLYRQQFIEKNLHIYCIYLGLVRGIIRPAMQILTGYYNGNLTNKNLEKWLNICYLNCSRNTILILINVVFHLNRNINDQGYLFNTFGDTMIYFNLVYCGGVGYLMYLQSF